MVFALLFTIVVFYDLVLEQIEVKTAFLYGIIDQLLYIKVPKKYKQY